LATFSVVSADQEGISPDFASGIIDSRRLAFNGTLIVLPLFITTRVVDAWRWG
jgi:hypothetical protein